MKLVPASCVGMRPEVNRPRWGSPCSGCSILTTEAPQSDRTAAAEGTNPHSATSSTRTPPSIDGCSATVEHQREAHCCPYPFIGPNRLAARRHLVVGHAPVELL